MRIVADNIWNVTSDARQRRRYAAVCLLVILFCGILKLPTLFAAHAEYDEQIYWALAANWLRTGSYSLQGTAILSELPPAVYDKPLFHHPPLLPMLLVPFVAIGSPQAAVVVSWLGHFAAIVGVALFAWTWRRRGWHGTKFELWLPVLAVSLDPVLSFCSRKLWLDGLAGGCVGLAMGLLCVAAASGRLRWAIGGGLVLGLAGLAKLPALTVLPAAVLLLALGPSARPSFARCPLTPRSLGRQSGRHPKRAVLRQLPGLRLVLAVVVPAILVVLPWFVVFFAHYGRLLPNWIHPDADMIQASGLVRRAMSQSWHYYLSQSCLVAPIVLVLVIACARRASRLWSVELGVPLVWIGAAVVSLTAVGLSGQGVQLRFLTIAAPGLYALLAGLLRHANPRRSMLPPVAVLAVLLGAMNIAFYLFYGLQFDEIVSFPELLWKMAAHHP